MVYWMIKLIKRDRNQNLQDIGANKYNLQYYVLPER